MLDRDESVVSTSLACLRDDFLLRGDEQVGLGVVALGTQHILPDESVEQVLQLGGIVRAVDDETLVFVVELSLSSEFAAEKLCRIGCRAVERLGNLRHVDDDSFDAVSLSFDLGANAGHLVAVVQVGDFTVDVQSTHGDCRCSSLS